MPLLHGLFLIAALAVTVIVPLLPELRRAYDLSTATVALLVAAPGLATLAASLPAGLLADRFGARRVTLWATLMLSISSLAQAAPSYAAVITGRFVFGVAFGMVWTTGVAWMAQSHAPGGSGRLGAVSTSAAVGIIVGPAFGGVVGQHFGVAAPFLVLGAVTAALAAALFMLDEPGPATGSRRQPAALRKALRLVRGEPNGLCGTLGLIIVGVVAGATQLLVPLQLHEAGFSASATGFVFAIAAGAYIVVSATIVRLGGRAITPRISAVACLLLAVSLLPAVLHGGAVAVIGALVLSAAGRGAVNTISYPLGARSEATHEVGEGVVMGILNSGWAVGFVLAPLIAGWLDELAGPGPAWLIAVIPGALGALLMLRSARAPSFAPCRAGLGASQ